MSNPDHALRYRVTVDGKFFRAGPDKFHVKGVVYGPFVPDAQGATLGLPEQARRDLEQIAALGANTVRVYHVPPRWFLDLAAEHALRLFIDIPWAKHLCFLDQEELQAEARRAVRDAVTACAGHPAVFAYSLVNEISPEVARWSGPVQVERFIESLAELGRSVDARALFTFASYPPTEFLQPRNLDFLCFNVYLHERPAFEAYLARLQTLAAERPLLLGELGMDSRREGELNQSSFLAAQIESAFRAGLAGSVVFSSTDDWFRGGMQIEDWAFGLTTRDRKPKASLAAVRAAYRAAPYFPLERVPKVSVVVASYNGGQTLRTCLESLGKLNYPDYEQTVQDALAENLPSTKLEYFRYGTHHAMVGGLITRHWKMPDDLVLAIRHQHDATLFGDNTGSVAPSIRTLAAMGFFASSAARHALGELEDPEWVWCGRQAAAYLGYQNKEAVEMVWDIAESVREVQGRQSLPD